MAEFILCVVVAAGVVAFFSMCVTATDRIVAAVLRAGRLSGRQVWVAGRVVLNVEQPPADGVSQWLFQGVFPTRDDAVAACRDATYFVAPATIGESLPHEVSEWPGAEFPAVDAVDLGEMLGKSDDAEPSAG